MGTSLVSYNVGLGTAVVMLSSRKNTHRHKVAVQMRSAHTCTRAPTCTDRVAVKALLVDRQNYCTQMHSNKHTIT